MNTDSLGAQNLYALAVRLLVHILVMVGALPAWRFL